MWVSREEIFQAIAAYLIVGAIHFVLRSKFIAITENSKKAKENGINVKLWDFLFYATLGIVVIHSVKIGGILIVFAFLVIPASISTLFSKNWSSRIIMAWIIGSIVSFIGLYFSWQMDLPSGPAVILVLGIVLFGAIILRKIVPRKS